MTKQSIITMSPIFNSLNCNIIVNIHHTLNNQLPCSQRMFIPKSASNFPMIAFSNINFNINRMGKWDTATRDMLHFHAKVLYGTYHWCHIVGFVWIQHKQWNNNSWYCWSVGSENFINAMKHCSLIYQFILLTIALTASLKICYYFATILLFCVPLKINIGVTFIPSAHTVNSKVACLVLYVEAWMLATFMSLISKVCLEGEVK